MNAISKILVVLTLINLIGFLNHCDAQTVLFEKQGISLSYTSSLVKTRECFRDNEKYDQYKIMVYLKNQSGKPVSMHQSHIKHEAPMGAICLDIGYTGETFDSRKNWKSGSTETKVYYTVVESGQPLPEPSWQLGTFKLE